MTSIVTEIAIFCVPCDTGVSSTASFAAVEFGPDKLIPVLSNAAKTAQFAQAVPDKKYPDQRHQRHDQLDKRGIPWKVTSGTDVGNTDGHQNRPDETKAKCVHASFISPIASLADYVSNEAHS